MLGQPTLERSLSLPRITLYGLADPGAISAAFARVNPRTQPPLVSTGVVAFEIARRLGC